MSSKLAALFVSTLLLSGLAKAQIFTQSSNVQQGTSASTCINPGAAQRVTVTDWNVSIIDAPGDSAWHTTFQIYDGNSPSTIYCSDIVSISPPYAVSDQRSGHPAGGNGYFSFSPTDNTWTFPSGHSACIAFVNNSSSAYEAVGIQGYVK